MTNSPTAAHADATPRVDTGKVSFASLGLVRALVQAAAASGFDQPTPIQREAIPAVLRGRDVIGSAQTGSGKTAAFALPILHRIYAAPRHSPLRVHALVIVPARELATQVGAVIRELADHLPERVKVAVLFGGVSINPQMMGLRGGAQAVVATPGRLLDLVEHDALDLSHVEMVVLDEADRLLELGFADEMARVLALLPTARQTLLFSATFPKAVQALADDLLRDPVRVEIEAAPADAPDIEQRALLVDTARRTPLLAHLIKQHEWSHALVFVATKYASGHVAEKLRRQGIDAGALSGDLTQGARTQVLESFKAGRLRVLVSTDVAARGIDIAGLPIVVNYDLPRSAVDYVHRIGRTGRAGLAGVALSFITADAEAHFRLIEKRQGKRVPRESITGFEPLEVASEAAATGGVKGLRKSKKDKLREAAGG